MRHAIAQCLAVALLVIAAPDARAQEIAPLTRASASLLAGVSQFDLSGTGNAPALSVRAEYDVRAWLILEGAVSFLYPDLDFRGRTLYVVPEVQAQVQLAGHMLRPYLGIGAGAFSGGGNSQSALSASGGIRSSTWHRRVDLRAELRVRGVGSGFTGSTADWLAGFSYRF